MPLCRIGLDLETEEHNKLIEEEGIKDAAGGSFVRERARVRPRGKEDSLPRSRPHSQEDDDNIDDLPFDGDERGREDRDAREEGDHDDEYNPEAAHDQGDLLEDG
jgi:hypothetical protein